MQFNCLETNEAEIYEGTEKAKSKDKQAECKGNRKKCGGVIRDLKRGNHRGIIPSYCCSLILFI